MFAPKELIFYQTLLLFSENDNIGMQKPNVSHIRYDLQSRVQFVWCSFVRKLFAENAYLIFTSWLYYLIMNLEINILWNVQTNGVVFTPHQAWI